MATKNWMWCAAVTAMVAAAGLAAGGEGVPSPKDILGMDVGQNRVLASYSESVRYLRALAERSPRVRVIEMGPTVEGRTMIAVAISSASNITRLDELRRGWARRGRRSSVRRRRARSGGSPRSPPVPKG